MMHDETRSGNGSITNEENRGGHASVMREPAATPEDLHRDAALDRDRTAQLKAMAITLAIVMAPFMGLAFGMNVALGALACAMAFTTWLSWSGARRVNLTLRSKLYTQAALNGVLTLVVIGVLLIRLTNK